MKATHRSAFNAMLPHPTHQPPPHLLAHAPTLLTLTSTVHLTTPSRRTLVHGRLRSRPLLHAVTHAEGARAARRAAFAAARDHVARRRQREGAAERGGAERERARLAARVGNAQVGACGMRMCAWGGGAS
eukprot:202726-Chlamydomonas_euryale.AAC.9